MDASRKTTLEQRLVIVLLVIFAVVLLNSLKTLRGSGKPKTQAANPITAVQQSIPKVVRQLREQIEEVTHQAQAPRGDAADHPASAPVQYTASNLRDPLISLLPKEDQAGQGKPGKADRTSPPPPPAQPPAVAVQGMVWGGPRPQALIDGELYEVGDAVQGARIVAIDRNGVTVELQGSTFHLTTPSAAAEGLRTRGMSSR
jgi:hypothetical protein